MRTKGAMAMVKRTPKPTKKICYDVSVISEMLETVQGTPVTGLVFFDGDCAMCAGHARRYKKTLARRGFCLAPMQTPGLRERLGIDRDLYKTRMWLLVAPDTLYGGADAVIYLAARIWWTMPLALIAALPGAMPVIRRIYRVIAAHRYRFGGSCKLEKGVTP